MPCDDKLSHQSVTLFLTMQSSTIFSVLIISLFIDCHIYARTAGQNIQPSSYEEPAAADSIDFVDLENDSETQNERFRSDPINWTPPIAVWSQLKFPVIPEGGLENRNSRPIPEVFDAKKLNASISADGFVYGNKFCQCGRRPWRAVPEDALSNDIPWTATLVLTKFAHPLVFCGGALISDLYVLTAAHCLVGLKPKDISIRLNEEEFLPSSATIYQTHKFDVEKIIIHEKYNRKTISNDIALLKLSQPIDFFDVPVSPACLPIKNDEYSSKYNGTVTRWVSSLDSRGNTSANTLQKMNLALISNLQCNLPDKYNGLVTDNQICTKSCQGDSGGPLIIERNDRKHLVGIGSWGLDCTQSFRPSVYTRVAKYAAWILKNSIDAEWCVE